MNQFITISNISYSYNELKALHDVNINIKENELFGVIGPDGAGKTTLFRILATLLIPNTGTVKYEGVDIIKQYKSIRKIIGYMPGRFSLYQDLTVEENLDFFASVFKTTVHENYHLIKNIYKQLEPFKKRRAGKLSGGMKQKLALSCALIHKPKILILDEPTTGVDAVSRSEFWDILSGLKKMGITIIVSTPYMDEARRCDRIALIKDGIILETDTPGNIEAQFDYKLFALKHKSNRQILKVLKSIDFILNSYAYGQEIHVVVDSEIKMNKVIQVLNNKGFIDIEYKKINPTIEDCFIRQMVEKFDIDEEYK